MTFVNILSCRNKSIERTASIFTFLHFLPIAIHAVPEFAEICSQPYRSMEAISWSKPEPQ